MNAAFHNVLSVCHSGMEALSGCLLQLFSSRSLQLSVYRMYVPAAFAGLLFAASGSHLFDPGHICLGTLMVSKVCSSLRPLGLAALDRSGVTFTLLLVASFILHVPVSAHACEANIQLVVKLSC